MLFRKKNRYGVHHDKRFEKEHIHDNLILLANSTHDTSVERASHCLFKQLLSKIMEKGLVKKVESFTR